MGHNVVADIGNPDTDMAGTVPPGDEFNQSGITWGTGGTFTCAGAYGCHGDRAITDKLSSIKGAHHTDDGILKFGSGFTETGQGDTTGLSYRFLKGVKGGEDTDWQATSSASDHNEYKGASDGIESGSASVPGGSTISGFCAECHGNFHGPRAVGSDITNTATGSPWLRHPTDIVILNTGEYAQYNTPNTGTSQYSLTAPLARQNIPTTASSGLVTLGTDIIMCLSCHRAHASPYFKIMRWDYKGWPASGGTNGCNVCHTSKN
jgi:hypothetical protein